MYPTSPIALLATLATLALAAPPLAAQEADCAAEVRAAVADGTTLHYFECGRGEPLVLVHGSLGDLHGFDAQTAAFAEGFRTIAYSRRFHPPNAPPTGGEPYDLRQHAADLAALLAELDAAPAHVLGHSYGAYVALALALERPEMVRTLVLAEPPLLPLLSRSAVGDALRERFDARTLEPVRAAFASGQDEVALRRFLDGVCGEGCFDRLPEPVRADLVERKATEFRLEMRTEAALYMPPLGCGALARLDRPSLLVTGERSPSFLLMAAGALERCLEGERHVMVTGAGHEMQMDNPPAFNAAVLDFLRRH